MGLLDDAIREHLELKRQHGADPAEVAQLEREAFGPAQSAPAPIELPPREPQDDEIADPVLVEPEVDAPGADEVAGELPWEDAAVEPPEPDPDATTVFRPQEVADAQRQLDEDEPEEQRPRRWFGRGSRDG